MNNELAALGRNIRRVRKRLELSQEAMAEKCGLHRTYISDIERGNRNPSFSSLVMMSRGLGLTVSELTKNIECPPPKELSRET